MPVMTIWVLSVSCCTTILFPCPSLSAPALLFKSIRIVWSKIPRGLKKGKRSFPEKSSPKRCMELRHLCEKNCFLLLSQHVFVVTFLFFPLRHISERFRSLFCSVQIHSQLISIVNTMLLLSKLFFDYKG